MLLVLTEGADVAGRSVDEAVSDHLILAFKALSARTSRAVLDRTKVWTSVGMDVRVAVEEVLCLKWRSRAPGVAARENGSEWDILGEIAV